MHLKTILNRVPKFKSFVYTSVRWAEDAREPTLETVLRPRAQGRAICSGCGCRRPGYDTLPERRFEFIPLWGIKVFFVYAPRRVSCRSCGVLVERLPWASGKHQLTETYAWFLAGWAKRLSWTEVAAAFRTTFDHVFCSVERAVTWGLEHRSLSGITALGIDEIAWQRGHAYLTMVYQIDAGCRRLLWLGRGRKAKTLLGFFRWFGTERSAQIRFICSDMWRPYLKVIARKAAQAIHVLDRFHIMANLSKAIDQVRAEESRQLKREGLEPVLTNSRWLLLKRPEHLTAQQETKLADLLRYNLRAVRSYLLKEEFQQLWSYLSPYWAGQFLDRWCTRTLRSQIEPMKKMARQMRRHRSLVLNWFRAHGQFSSGIVEGFNNKAKLTTRKAYGFRTYRAAEVALYHTPGALPVPEATHEFF
ncbi:MAG: ISL3 family transposase [Gemmatimonadales bacterium]|nr:ISL3 family transposase [Gemmatimonadales bacterium]